LTDPAVVGALGSHWKGRGGAPIKVALHGTPRQWGDRRRPWIWREARVFQQLLQQADVPVVVRR
jgi:hypothetical protein